MRRIFFALWPDRITQQKIVEEFKQTSAFQFSQTLNKSLDVYPPSNIHMTLHFLGNVTQEQLDCVIALPDIKQAPFELNLSYVGCFEKAQVTWLGANRVPDNLSQLYLKLAAVIHACGLQTDSRLFNPHVTLMRHFSFKNECVLPKAINWKVDRFALVESLTCSAGVIYKPIKFYNLTYK